MELGDRIVQFISGLIPAYTHEEVDGIWCARSLVDGTLICPVEEQEGNENGFVKVYWQGDWARQSMMIGTFVASCAVAKYIELHCIGRDAQNISAELRHLTHHFTLKTGEELVFEMEAEDSRLLHILEKAIKKIGQEAVTEIIKKTVGL
jgi:hypothetical protein